MRILPASLLAPPLTGENTRFGAVKERRRVYSLVFEIAVETTFAAAHALTIAGEREPMHGHNWRVRAVVSGPRLDDDGLLCDFHHVEEALAAIVAPWRNRCLNDIEPFDRLSPSAERVAEHIAARLAATLPRTAGAEVRVARVAVTEAPGCEAVCVPPASRA